MLVNMGDAIAGYIERRGGTLQTSELVRCGYSRVQIQAAIKNGAITVLRQGVVGTESADAEQRVAVLANGLITCISAAQELGLWTIKDPEQLHLWTLHSRQPASTIKHRGDLVRPHRPGNYVSILDCVLHAIRCRPRLEALVIAESAVRRGVVSKAELLELLPGKRNGIRRAVVLGIGDDADSPLEIIARDLFRAVGLRVETQVPIPGLGRVDIVVEGRIIIELDGFDFHSDRAAFKKDRKRNNAGMLSGFPTLRYVYEDLVFTPQNVIAEVMTMLRRVA